MKDWLKKDRCSICHDERAVRYCLRQNKDIGWKCCNNLRSDSKCPEPCNYTPINAEGSPLPKIKSDSRTEFIDYIELYLNYWIHRPQPALSDASPANIMQSTDGKKILEKWLSGFSYPDAQIIRLLNKKLNLGIQITDTPEFAESISHRILEAITTRDWDKVIDFYTKPDQDKQKADALIIDRIKSHPLLSKATHWQIINSGISEDKKQAFAFYEINGKDNCTFIYTAAQDGWTLYQTICGTLQDYYAQKTLFRDIATALAAKVESQCYNLLQQSKYRYPLCPDLDYYWGLYYLMLKRTDDAVNCFESALLLDPAWNEPLIQLAISSMNAKEYQASLDKWQLLSERNPQDINILNNLGVCYLGLNQQDKAIAIWQSALKINPDADIIKKNLEHQSGG